MRIAKKRGIVQDPYIVGWNQYGRKQWGNCVSRCCGGNESNIADARYAGVSCCGAEASA